MWSRKLALICLVLILTAALVFPIGCSKPTPIPTTTGNLQVNITDINNNPLNGAKVVSTAQPEGQTALNGITTDAGNTVTFSNVKIGQYSISINQFNYQGVIINTNVVAGQTTTISAKLVKNPS
jgi:hypothetical protein